MKDDQEWCMDIFDHFVLAGESITVGEAVIRRYRPVSAENDHIILRVFSSDRDDCKVTFIIFYFFSLNKLHIFGESKIQYIFLY